MQPASSLWARWGLIVTTGLTAAILVATATASYLGARAAAATLVRARALDLSIAVRRSLRLAGLPRHEVLVELLDDMEEQGLRAIAIVGPAQPPIEAGPLDPSRRDRVAVDCTVPVAANTLDWRADNVVFAQPLAPGRGHGFRRHGNLWPRPPDGLAGACLILSFSSATAHATMGRALTTLAASTAAAVLLLVAAIGFWRMSRREEKARAELLVDRHLRHLGEVSAVLGHELRNPLASLKGHAQLLVGKLEPQHPGRRGAETVVQEAIRLERLTDEVLEYARTAALHRDATDPLAAAQAAVSTVDDDRVKIVAPASVPAWPLDRARIEQALVNLLRNALQSSEPPTPVELEVTHLDHHLRFEVRDRGVGLRPDELERVFEPFYTRRVRGTGLGLALAKRIAEGHGGTLRARNRTGGGAAFLLEIPFGPNQR